MTTVAPLAEDAALTGKDFNRLHACVHMVTTQLEAHVARFDDHRVEVNGKLDAVATTAAGVTQRLDVSDAQTVVWRARAVKRATATNDTLKRLTGKFEVSLRNQSTHLEALGLKGGKRPIALLSTAQLGKRALLFVGMVGGGGAGLAWLYRFVASVWPSVNHFLLTR